MLQTSCTALVLLLLGLSQAALDLPPYIKPCGMNNPNFNECARQSAINAIPQFINGDPKYRVPQLDPMLVTELIIQEGTKSVGMTMVARNASLTGLKDVDMRATRFDFDKQHIEYDWFFRRIDINSNYNVSGQVLLLPIFGSGKALFTLSNITGKYAYDYDIVKKKDGKDYMVPKKPEFDFKPRHMSMHLDNLFNGDKFLGDNMNKFLNDNWDEILKDVGPAIQDAIGEYINQILTSVFSLVPLKVAIPDKL